MKRIWRIPYHHLNKNQTKHMKTSIVKISKPNGQLAGTNRKNKNVNTLADYQDHMQQLWLMYQEQLQRNFDLMQIINKQQLLLQAPVSFDQPQKFTVTTEQEPAKEPQEQATEIEPLHFKRLNTLSHNLQSCGIITRIDAANGVVNFLYILQCMGGSAIAELLFQTCDVSVPTGYRYAALLNDCDFLNYKGDKFGMKYMLTPLGEKFLSGEIIDAHQLREVHRAIQ